jgi:hypothetical protein
MHFLGPARIHPGQHHKKGSDRRLEVKQTVCLWAESSVATSLAIDHQMLGVARASAVTCTAVLPRHCTSPALAKSPTVECSLQQARHGMGHPHPAALLPIGGHALQQGRPLAAGVPRR